MKNKYHTQKKCNISRNLLKVPDAISVGPTLGLPTARGALSSPAWSVSGILQPVLRPSSRLVPFSFPNLERDSPPTLQEAWISSSPVPSSSWRRYSPQSVIPTPYPVTDSLVFYSSVKVLMPPYVPPSSHDHSVHPGGAVVVVQSPRFVADENYTGL
jgi:hypothetical protein